MDYSCRLLLYAAVYKKTDANGNILWRKEDESAWRLLASANYVSHATVE
jgi:hypothetical protein